MKRVKQISLDVLVDGNIDGCKLAEEIADFLEVNKYDVLVSEFQEDMTDIYKKYGYSM